MNSNVHVLSLFLQLNINPFLVNTLFTSRIVFVMYSTFSSSSSSLVFEFRNLMISLAVEGISPSSLLILSMACLLFSTRSCCLNMICTRDQIFFLELEMSVQIFSLASANVFPATICFWSCCISCLSFFFACLSTLYLVWKEDLSS